MNELDFHITKQQATLTSYASTNHPIGGKVKPKYPDRVPCTGVCPAYVQKQYNAKTLCALMDSGSSATLIHARALPPGAVPTVIAPITNNTAAGDFNITRQVTLNDIRLPEFGNAVSQEIDAYVFDSKNCPYDIIVGRDWLNPNGFDFAFSEGVMRYSGETVAMRKPYQIPTFHDHNSDFFDSHAAHIKPASYKEHSLKDVLDGLSHLTVDQKDSLRKVLEGCTTLFNGKLKRYKKRKMHLELKPGAEPVHCRPFPIPHIHYKTFKDEIERLESEGVLSRVWDTEHAYPTFIIPKKDGTVRVISDFRKLNANIKRKIYPLPRIKDILHRRRGYRYFTKIDVSMQYYTFEMTEDAKMLCVIVTPFGKFRYERAPMGIKQSPDFAQQAMEEILHDLPDVEAYIDDIGIFSDSYDDHIATITTVLKRLQENGFTVHPYKCEWAVQETDWLGYWLTPTGVKPWNKKVQAILQLAPPRNISELRSFIGAVNYYRDMWPRRAHLLAPLTAMTGQKQFQWTTEMHKAFLHLKKTMAADVHLAYPDHNKPFTIETDASDYQLGAVIKQDDKPVAYFSRKLNAAQRNYTTMEKELLSIVEVFKEFRSMLLGAKIHVFTDHRNLTYTNLNTQRVLRWRLYLDEYDAEYHYIPGESNVLADFLSRSPLEEEKSDDPIDYSFFLDDFHIESYLNAPPHLANPLDYRRIAQFQQNEPGFLQQNLADPHRYPMHHIGNVPLLCYHAPNTDTAKIFIPNNLIDNIIRWYHSVLGHAGQNRLFETMNRLLYHPQLRHRCYQHVQSCRICQQYKHSGRGFGLLPPREALAAPFHDIAVDLIGPWAITVNNQNIKFQALTAVDPVTTLSETVIVDNKTARHVAHKFETLWLHRYPRPVNCIYDQGSEFIGFEFDDLLYRWGIHKRPITSKNPQANAVCERMHQTVADLLRTMNQANPPQNEVNARAAVERAISIASHALRITTHSTLGYSPGSIVFNRDMLLDIPFVADLLLLREQRQQRIDYNLKRENSRRRNFDYVAGQQAWIKKYNPATLQVRKEGPFLITQIHTNGTVTLRRRGNVVERINIRRLEPYRA